MSENEKIRLHRVNFEELLEMEEIVKYEVNYHKDFPEYLTVGVWIDDGLLIQHRFELQCKFCENSKLKFDKKQDTCKCEVCKKTSMLKESMIGKLFEEYI